MASTFNPFNYLRLLFPIPLFSWFWADKALHKMELEWVRANPSDLHTLEAACRSGKMAICSVYLPVSLAQGLSLAILVLTLKLMLIAASMPQWSPRWQKTILKNAKLVGGIGLGLTLLMIIGRGIVSTLTVWFIPKVWWGNDAIAIAAVIGLIALTRVPPHIKIIWSLLFQGIRQRVGRVVSRTESSELWRLIDETCTELGITSPTQLVLGLAPDCRLHVGKVYLEPESTLISGEILYLGATLAETLDEASLRSLLKNALLRRRGALGQWLPAVEDWLVNAENFLQVCKSRHHSRQLASAADPALACWEGWLAIVKKLMQPFEAEHLRARQTGMNGQAEEGMPNLLSHAAEAWRKHIVPRFILDLSSGVARPRVMEWFAHAFHHGDASTASASALKGDPSLQHELILLERQWLIDSGQLSVPD